MAEWGTLAFHYLCFLIHLIGVTYYLSEIKLQSHGTYGGRFKFLTFINMLVQFLYFNMAAVTGIHELMKKRKNEVFSSVCDYTFTCVAFPFGLTVSILFWALYMADPHSCQTKEDAKFIPALLNHYMHTFPFASAIFELCFIRHKYPPRKKGLLSVLGIGVVYIAWVLWIAFAAGIWVYPFLEKMSAVSIAAFFASAVSFVLFLYLIGEWVAIRRWGVEVSEEKKKL